MAIIETREVAQRQAAVDSSGGTSYTRVYRVTVDDPTPTDLLQQARQAPGIAIGDPFPTDPGSLCTTVQAQDKEDDGLTIEVRVEYAPPSGGDSQSFTNPLYSQVEVSGTPQQYQKNITMDAWGVAIRNSFGDPNGEPVQREDSRLIVTFKKNVAYGAFNPVMAIEYMNCVNATWFSGGRPNTVRVVGFPYSRAWHSACGYYWIISPSFHYNPMSHNAIFLDRGFRWLDSNDKTTDIDEATGCKPSEPVLLDGTGHRLAKDADPVFHWVNPYPIVPFTPLSFLLGV